MVSGWYIGWGFGACVSGKGGVGGSCGRGIPGRGTGGGGGAVDRARAVGVGIYGF